MKIILDQTGKKFNTEWIFRNLTYTFEENKSYAILGRNGSGKSTLLQIIAGNLHPTKGTVSYRLNGSEIKENDVFRYLSVSASYQELIEEFTLEEMLKFHFHFKTIRQGHTIDGAIELMGLDSSRKKQIRQFSSGMKQRVKLILAFLSETPLLLLDEPTTNLDQPGTEWYLNLIGKYSANRTLIICSNLQQTETSFCSGRLFVEDYK